MLRMTRTTFVSLAVAGAVAAGVVTGCAAAGSTANSATVSLVSYSTPQKPFAQITKDFAATDAGKGVQFRQSFGASGAQARAVAAGLKADVVEFALEPDISRLVTTGKVAPEWNSGDRHGILTTSLVVFGVRSGNPKHIASWEDIVRSDVKVVTPNPFSSGGARWNIMAAYGSQRKAGKTHEQALDFVKRVLRNTATQPDSAVKATAAFVAGTGDVLLTYENEAIEAKQAKQKLDYVVPESTIKIENPVALTKTGAKNRYAQAFVDYLFSDAAQRVFMSHGYRPGTGIAVDAQKFPAPKHLFSITDFGGWDKVTKEFFDKDNGYIAEVENQLGVSGG